MKFHNQKSFMGHEISNVTNKPLLHKKGKQWIVVAISALILAGFGGVVSTTTHADTTTNNGVKTESATSNSANNKPASASNTQNQAKALHINLLQNADAQKPSNLATTNNNGNNSNNSSNKKPAVHMLGGSNLADSTPIIKPDNNINHSGLTPEANGNWGTATWNLYTNGQLDIHDGSLMSDNHFIGYGGSNATNLSTHTLNPNDVKSIYTYKVIAPTNSMNLFSGNTGQWTTGGGEWNHFNNVQHIDLSGLDTSNVTNMAGMFHGDSNLLSINFGPYFNTIKVTDMSSMFDDVNHLTNLDLSTFDTRNVHNFAQMFYNAKSIHSIDLSKFTMKRSDNVSGMFAITSSTYGNAPVPTVNELILNRSFKNINTSNAQLNNNGIVSQSPNTKIQVEEIKNNVPTGKIYSDWSEIAQNSDDAPFISKDALQTYNVKFLNMGTYSDVNSQTNTITGLKNAAFLPTNGINIPDGYKLVNNATTTTDINGNTATFHVVRNNVVANGTWGTEPWTLDNNNVMTVYGVNGKQLASHADPNDSNGYGHLTSETGISQSDSNKVHKIVFMHNVTAPSNCNRLIDNENDNSQTNPKHYGSDYFQNLSDIDVGGLDTSNTHNFFAMFCGLSHLNRIDNLPYLDMNNISGTGNTWIFGFDSNLKSLDLSNAKLYPSLNDGSDFRGDTDLSKLTLGSNVSFDGNINLSDKGVINLNGTNLPISTFENGQVHPGTWYVYKDSGIWGTANWYLLNDNTLLVANGTLSKAGTPTSHDALTASNILTHNVTAPSDSSNLFSKFTKANPIDLTGMDFTNANNVKGLLPAGTEAKYNNSFDTALDNQAANDSAAANASAQSAETHAISSASSSAAQSADVLASAITHVLYNGSYSSTSSLTSSDTSLLSSLATDYKNWNNASTSAQSGSKQANINATTFASALNGALSNGSYSSNGSFASLTQSEKALVSTAATDYKNWNNGSNQASLIGTAVQALADVLGDNESALNKADNAISTKADNSIIAIYNSDINNLSNNVNKLTNLNSQVSSLANLNSAQGRALADTLANNEKVLSSDIASNIASLNKAINTKADNVAVNGVITVYNNDINKLTDLNSQVNSLAGLDSAEASNNANNISTNSANASSSVASLSSSANTVESDNSANATSSVNSLSNSANAGISNNSSSITSLSSSAKNASVSASSSVASLSNSANAGIAKNSNSVNSLSGSASKGIASNATRISNNSNNINTNSKTASNGISNAQLVANQNSASASISAFNANSNADSYALSLAQNATGVANANAGGIDNTMSYDDQTVQSLSNTVNANTISLANNDNDLYQSKENKPATKKHGVKIAQLHQPLFYFYALKPLWLHTSAKFTKGNRAEELSAKHGYTLPITRIFKVNGALRFEVKIDGAKYFVTGNRYFARNAYIQPNEIKHNSSVKVLRAIREYKRAGFGKKNFIKGIRKGTVLPIKQAKTIANKQVTRLQLTNGHWITANKNLVKLI